MANKFLFLRAENSPFVGNAADITKNSVLSHSNVDNNFIFLKGEDILTGSTAGNDLILNKVNSDKITIDLSSISGGGATTLNNGDIFVGNTSNVATSVTMTGDTLISNTGVVTIQPDVVTYNKMQDVTAKSVLGNSTGAGTIAEIPIIEHYIPAGATRTLLETTSNWDVNGNYTGASITGTFQGQSHYNGDYWFTAVADNTWIRLIRG